jgi:hypothetical protein
MKTIRVIREIRGSISFIFVFTLACNSARADGGALRLSETRGDLTVSVFTSPTPLRAGQIDVSVLVQDAANSRTIQDAEVFVSAAPLGRRADAIRRQATAEQAANKLFQAAEFDLPVAGRWEFSIEVASIEAASIGGGGPSTAAPLTFEAEVAEPLPQWLALAPWIGWPWLVIAVFAAQRCLRRRPRRR